MIMSTVSSPGNPVASPLSRATDKWSLLAEWQEAERRLMKACDQLDSLALAIEEIEDRIERATEHGTLAAVYSLQIKLDVIRNMRCMYYTYAETKAEAMNYLWEKMTQCPTFEAKDLDLDVRRDLLMDV